MKVCVDPASVLQNCHISGSLSIVKYIYALLNTDV